MTAFLIAAGTYLAASLIVAVLLGKALRRNDEPELWIVPDDVPGLWREMEQATW